MRLKRLWASCTCQCRSIIPSGIASSRRRSNASFVCRPIGFGDGSDCDVDVDRVRALAHGRRLTMMLQPRIRKKTEWPERRYSLKLIFRLTQNARGSNDDSVMITLQRL